MKSMRSVVVVCLSIIASTSSQGSSGATETKKVSPLGAVSDLSPLQTLSVNEPDTDRGKAAASARMAILRTLKEAAEPCWSSETSPGWLKIEANVEKTPQTAILRGASAYRLESRRGKDPVLRCIRDALSQIVGTGLPVSLAALPMNSVTEQFVLLARPPRKCRGN